MAAKIRPILLCGGSGTRLWPLSTKNFTKQFLRIDNALSLFQQTLRRIDNDRLFTAPLLVSNIEQRHTLLTQLKEVQLTQEPSIIFEPVGRNTAAAITTALLHIKQDYSQPDLPVLILPIDHSFSDDSLFLQEITKLSRRKLCTTNIITFGIVPRRAETEYGYIEKGERLAPKIFRVKKFQEKPNHQTAAEYCSTHRHYWNSGLYLSTPRKMLSTIRKHTGLNIISPCSLAIKQGVRTGRHLVVDEQAFARAPNISIDKAVIEKSASLLVQEIQVGWEDLGNWNTLLHFLSRPHGDKVVPSHQIAHAHTQTDTVTPCEIISYGNYSDKVWLKIRAFGQVFTLYRDDSGFVSLAAQAASTGSAAHQ